MAVREKRAAHRHARADRKIRDELVEAGFAAAGFPLLRVPVKSGYAPLEIQNLINPYLHSIAPVPPIAPVAPSAQASATAPACPKCGATMLLRTAKTERMPVESFGAAPIFPAAALRLRCRSDLIIKI